jgi:hypothetical protein
MSALSASKLPDGVRVDWPKGTTCREGVYPAQRVSVA